MSWMGGSMESARILGTDEQDLDNDRSETVEGAENGELVGDWKTESRWSST